MSRYCRAAASDLPAGIGRAVGRRNAIVVERARARPLTNQIKLLVGWQWRRRVTTKKRRSKIISRAFFWAALFRPVAHRHTTAFAGLSVPRWITNFAVSMVASSQ